MIGNEPSALTAKATPTPPQARDNCSTIPDSEDGQTKSEACAVANCPAQASPLLFGDAEAKSKIPSSPAARVEPVASMRPPFLT